MSFAGTAALGAVAGLTIFLGLPVARLGRPATGVLAFLNAASIGVLLFLLYDVVAKANSTIEQGLTADRLRGSGYGLVLATGFSVGLLGLVCFERFVMRRSRRQSRQGGPGAMAADSAALADGGGLARRRPVSAMARVATLIAVGIGLHNFSEGLAIGQSAGEGAYSLFGVLVIGFGLHNITEGFGITAPIAGERPSWSFLLMLGIIGGGPTFLGTVLGYWWTSPAVSVLFLSLAAGAIVYVIGELMHAGRRIGAHDLAMVGLLAGFLLGYGTDKLLFVAGG